MKYGDKIYFSLETDEVVNFKNKEIKIDENYKYLPTNKFLKSLSFLIYKFIATPFAFITFKIFKHIKFHNAKILKQYKKGGYFIYANHTNQYLDGLCPALICFPKKPYIIVNSANTTIPIIGKYLKLFGALPVPNSINATKNLYNAINTILSQNNPILIYPEAHLWPYYTKIRNFSTVSFRYPVKFKKPVFTFTTVYKKRKHRKFPKIEIYVDGPFFANENLNEKLAQEELRNIVFDKLDERSNLSNYEYVKYIKKEK